MKGIDSLGFIISDPESIMKKILIFSLKGSFWESRNKFFLKWESIGDT